MPTAKTLGQLTDEGAPISELFELVRQLCVHLGYVPVGFRRFDLPDGFAVTVNGTKDERLDEDGMAIPPFHASASRHGWPVGIFTMFGGTLIAGMEDPLIAALKQQLTSRGTAIGA